MMNENKLALLYRGTPYRKQTSTYAVEVTEVCEVLYDRTRMYFFDTLDDATKHQQLRGTIQDSHLYDLSIEQYNDQYSIEKFGLLRFIEEKDLFELGEGTTAKVFQWDTLWVVRVATHDYDGGLVTYHIPDCLRERLHLPTVDRVRSDIGSNAIFVEKLFKVNHDLFIGTNSAFNKMNNPIFSQYRGFKLKDYLDPSHILYPLVYKTLVLYRYLRRKGIYATMDLNAANIMARKDGKLILNDVIGVIIHEQSFSTPT